MREIGIKMLPFVLTVLVLGHAASARAAGLLSWSRPALIDPQPPAGALLQLDGISCPSSGLCVAAGAGTVAWSTDPAGGGTAWNDFPLDGRHQITAIACPSATLCVAVDSAGNLLTSTDPTGGAHAWSIKPVSSLALATVSCASVSLCVAAGRDVVLSSSSPSDPAAWNGGRLPAGEHIASLSCPTASLCVGVDQGSPMLVSTDPTGGISTWKPTAVASVDGLLTVSCASASLCVAAGDGGDVSTSSDPTGGPNAWKDSRLAQGVSGCDRYGCYGGQFNAVACPAASLCIVFDSSGPPWTSANPNGGASAWRTGGSAAAAANAASCPAVSFCATARGTTVFTSTDPGAASPQWSTARDERVPGLTGVSCPSASVCVAVDGEGNAVTSADAAKPGAGWSGTHVDANWSALEGVSCPVVSLCVAVDSQGDVLTSTHPLGGRGAWQLAHVDDPAPLGIFPTLIAVSCASSSLCVAGGDGQDLVVSTDPTAGASAWKRVKPPGSGIGTIESISCPTTSLCVVGGFTGRLLISTDPAAGASAWRVSSVNSQWVMHGMSCVGSSFCAGLDNGGDVFTSSRPAGARGAWRIATVTAPGVASHYSLACPSRTLCVGTADSPSVIASEDPAGGPGMWATSTIDAPSAQLSSVTCPSTRTCIALDTAGQAMVGQLLAPPTPGQVKSALRHQLRTLARRIRRQALVRTGRWSFRFAAPGPGRMTELWYARGRHGGVVKVASGGLGFASAGSAGVVMRLTPAGRRLLRRGGRAPLELRVTAVLAPIRARRETVSVRIRVPG